MFSKYISVQHELICQEFQFKFSLIFLQIHDKESTREKPVWNEELQEEMVSPHQPRVYLPQNER